MTKLPGLPVVDLHSHVIADDAARYPLAPMGGKQSDWSKERPVNCAGMLEAMLQAGVAQSVLVQASTCYGHDNRYVQACVNAYPHNFAGVFSVDMQAADAGANIRKWMESGLSGARVFIAGHTAADHTVRLDDPRAFAAWSYIEERRIPICVQLRADGLPQLETLLTRFPNAVVLLDHFARPVLDDGPPYAKAASLLALACFPNLYFKYTTHNVRESKEGEATQASFIRAMVDAFGAQRIGWGSNFPAASGTLASLLNDAMAATASLSALEREWIFSRTARSLYPALGPHEGRTADVSAFVAAREGA
jgi:predicted TIM-barrel fold metal-dependent hydrolase